MKAIQRRVRVAALVGALAVAGAGTIIAAGTASANEPAKCVENVNVREEPKIDSQVIALCKAGTAVQAGEVRNGFVQLVDLGGWSAQEFISIDGKTPAKAGATSGETEEGADATTGADGKPKSTDGEESTADGSGEDSKSTKNGDPAEGSEPSAQEPKAKPGPVGGLPLPLPGQ